MHPMLTIAIKAARRAGGVINRAARNLDVLAVREKATNDFVSEVDKESEQTIIRSIRF
jgi:myo-inositol-1(or 4)-monophosphatase